MAKTSARRRAAGRARRRRRRPRPRRVAQAGGQAAEQGRHRDPVGGSAIARGRRRRGRVRPAAGNASWPPSSPGTCPTAPSARRSPRRSRSRRAGARRRAVGRKLFGGRQLMQPESIAFASSSSRRCGSAVARLSTWADAVGAEHERHPRDVGLLHRRAGHVVRQRLGLCLQAGRILDRRGRGAPGRLVDRRLEALPCRECSRRSPRRRSRAVVAHVPTPCSGRRAAPSGRPRQAAGDHLLHERRTCGDDDADVEDVLPIWTFSKWSVGIASPTMLFADRFAICLARSSMFRLGRRRSTSAPR